MKINIVFLLLTILFTVSCSHLGQRDIASTKNEKETTHEKYQGLFDKQY